VPPFGRNIGELTHPQWGWADAPVVDAAETIVATANPIIVVRITVLLLTGGAPQPSSMKLNCSDAVAACDAPCTRAHVGRPHSAVPPPPAFGAARPMGHRWGVAGYTACGRWRACRTGWRTHMGIVG
jgi:hypothetical protein